MNKCPPLPRFLSRLLEVVLALWLCIGGAIASAQSLQTSESYYGDGSLWLRYTYYLDENGHPVMQGRSTEYYQNGRKKEEGDYLNNQRNGSWTAWFDTGQKSSEGGYQLDKWHGLWTYWNAAGQKTKETDYNLGWPAKDTSFFYWPTGELLLEKLLETVGQDLFLRDTVYYTNGRVSQVANSKNNKLHGVSRSYYSNGQMQTDKQYEEGQPVGTFTYWFENGAKQREEFYQGGAKARSLEWTYYFVSGSVETVTDTTYTDASGTKSTGVLTGYYDTRNGNNGELERVQNMKDGLLEGRSDWWWSNGFRHHSAPYVKGKVRGMELYWDSFSFWATNYSKEGFPVSWGICYVKRFTTGLTLDDVMTGTWITTTTESGFGGYRVSSAYYVQPPATAPPPEYKQPQLDRRQVRGLVSQARTGDPVEAAQVEVGPGSPIATGGDGFYQTELVGLDFSAAMTVRASKDGYRPAQQTVDLRSRQSATVNFSLEPLTTDNAGVPVITSLKSKLGDFFLESVPVYNEYTAYVDWNGAQPGKLLLNRNGTVSEVAADARGGAFSFNMGSDFIASLDPNRNTLFVIAQTAAGVKSPVKRLQPVVVPYPAWTQPLSSAFSYLTTAKYPAYGLSSTWPEPGFELNFHSNKVPALVWSAWSVFPFVGGKNFGLKETQFTLGAEYKTDGTGTIQVGGQTGFEAGGATILGKTKGAGKLAFKAGKGLMWEEAEAAFNIEGKVERDLGIVDLVPPVAAVAQLPIVGRVLIYWTGNAHAKGALTVGGGATFKVVPEGPFPWLTNGAPEFSGAVALALSAEIIRGVETELSGGGTFKLVGRPLPLLELDKLEAELSAKLAVVVRNFKREFEKKHTFTYQFPSGPPGSPAAPMPALLAGEGFAPIGRDFLARAPYSQFMARPPRVAAGFGGSAPSQRLLVGNVFPYAQPSLAVQDGKAAIAFVYFDPNDPTLRANEIALIWFDGQNYSAPVLALNDTRSEFAPSIAFDSTGKVVAVWERVKDESFNGPNLEDMMPLLEIVAARFDPATATWTPPVALTDNNYLDHSPLLRRGADGSLFLVWQSNPANDLIGSAQAPSRLHHTRWNAAAGAFEPFATAPDGLTNVVSLDLAFDGTEALIVYAQDLDGDPATPNDVELFELRHNGSAWSAPRRLTTNSVPDLNPRVLYRAAGTPELLWQQGTNLARLTDWPTAASTVIRQGSAAFTLADFQLACDPQGRLVICWQDADELGPDLFYSVYDPARQTWSRDLRLTRDAALEKAVTGAFASDGTLHLAFNKKTLTNDVTDLYHLTYRLRTDAAIEANALTVLPANPVPGQAVTLKCQVRNAGDTALDGLSVSFYLGSPGPGAQWLGDAPLLPNLLVAGDVAEAVLNWTVPTNDALRVLHAVVDSANALAESDESNNTGILTFQLPDVQVVQVRVDEHGDGRVDLTAVLRNNGPVTATNVPVLFRADSRNIATNVIGGLLPGMEAEITLTVYAQLTFTNLPALLEVVADPQNLIAESNKENNSLSRMVVLLTDSDADGMPDQWERAHFGDHLRDGLGDLDGDGMADLLEYLAGTDPASAASSLRGDIVRTDGQGNWTIAWAAQPGKTYQVQYRDSFNQPAWTSLGSALTATTTVGSVTDRPPADAPRRFYRVLLVTPPVVP